MCEGPGMAIDDLPLPVVTFLNAIGVPWPYLNEDTASEFAGLVRSSGRRYRRLTRTRRRRSRRLALG